jgi:glycosyltransferase involved in cell wall biosynthesis
VCLTADGLGEGTTGGAENQVALLLSHLVSRGHEATLVVPGLADPPSTRQGVRVLSGWDPQPGVRGLRAFTYRLPLLRQVLRKVAADAYYVRGFSYFAPSLVSAARDAAGASLLALASDADLRLRREASGGDRGSLYQRLFSGRTASLYYQRRGLSRATRVIAQTTGQLEECGRLGLPAVRIANIVEEPPSPWPVAGPDDDADVIWVGSLSLWKGVDALAALAAALPEVRFEVVGPRRDTVAATTLDRLLLAANVRYLGEMPHAAAWERMRRARLLANTSPLEGFSNAMLEAWAVGTPVVSLAANPDDLLAANSDDLPAAGRSPERRSAALGLCAGGSPAALVDMVRGLLNDEEGRRAAGRRAIDYVRSVHSPAAVCLSFEELVGGAQTAPGDPGS